MRESGEMGREKVKFDMRARQGEEKRQWEREEVSGEM